MYHHRGAMITPELEQQWSDEVHYLHSLYRQGPPTTTTSNPNPNFTSQSAINTNLSASTTVSFKKKRRNKNKIPPIITDNSAWESALQDPKPQTESARWPDPIPLPEFPNPVSTEEQKNFAAIQLQRKSIMACQVFFSRNDDEEEDDDDEVEGKVKEKEEMEFFLGVFKEDEVLRKYYEKNLENGEFSCLACGGIGEKVGKKFRDCVALVQHSLTIARTKGKRAHRAYGKAICQVLGWNSDKVPGIGSFLIKGDTQENNNSDDNSVGEEQAEILSNKVDCSMELNKGYQIESPLPSELEAIPFSAINTTLAPLTPITDVEAVPNPQTEIPVSKPESLVPVPDEELEKFAAIQLQGNRLLACQTFFSSNKDLGEDEEIEFFLGLFADDNNELKTYYEKNSENGEFRCLVCDGIRKKKVGKRFKNCLALVQHSFTITKANVRSAHHRAFGKAICQVLGWNTHGHLLDKSDSGKPPQC